MKTKKKKKQIKSYLVFTLENELFAVDVKKVMSLENMKDVTHVPKSEKHLRGVINLRGEIIPVIDTHVKFNMDKFKQTTKTSIVVLQIRWNKFENIKLGLIVDKVNAVVGIPGNKILPPPEIGNSYKSKYITGIYKSGDDSNLIMLIDIEKALSINELSLIAQASENNDKAVQDNTVLELADD